MSSNFRYPQPGSPRPRPEGESHNLKHMSYSTSYTGPSGPSSPASFNKEFAVESLTVPTSPNRAEPLPTLDSNIKARRNPFARTYFTLNRMFGFKEKYTFLWMFIFGGALLGFCLARSATFNPKLVKKETAAGEFFWFDRPFFKINYLIHIYLTLIGGIMVGPQFFPGMRRRAVILHRLNGYFCLFCLVPGNICGSLVAARAYGGEINVQLTYYLLGIMITVSGFLGWWNVKRNTKNHRKWMLRMVTYFCVVITSRIISSIAKEIVTVLGTFYSAWRCDQIIYTLNNLDTAHAKFPQCFNGDPSTIFLAVLADMKGTKVNKASAGRVCAGMALWLATLLHTVGVEIYISATESANANRRGYALEPIDYDGDEPLWEYRK